MQQTRASFTTFFVEPANRIDQTSTGNEQCELVEHIIHMDSFWSTPRHKAIDGNKEHVIDLRAHASLETPYIQ